MTRTRTRHQLSATYFIVSFTLRVLSGCAGAPALWEPDEMARLDGEQTGVCMHL